MPSPKDDFSSVSYSKDRFSLMLCTKLYLLRDFYLCHPSAGPHRCRMRVAERQQLLRQYFFECRCQACLEESQSDDKSVVAMRNSFCCPSCQAPMQVVLPQLCVQLTGTCTVGVSGKVRELKTSDCDLCSEPLQSQDNISLFLAAFS